MAIDQEKINDDEKNQPDDEKNQTIDSQINGAENEIAQCLKVDSTDSDSSNDDRVSVEKKRFVPKTLKTRADLIRKIKQSSEALGNQDEVKAMRLHRRRRNSLDGILREQVAKVVQKHAEKAIGIPQDSDKRLAYAVDMCYRLDLCFLKIIERVVDYCNVGVTVSGLAETIDQDANLKGELKDALKDFIEERKIRYPTWYGDWDFA